MLVGTKCAFLVVPTVLIPRSDFILKWGRISVILWISDRGEMRCIYQNKFDTFYHVTRAHRSHRWGHWFESSTDHHGTPWEIRGFSFVIIERTAFLYAFLTSYGIEDNAELWISYTVFSKLFESHFEAKTFLRSFCKKGQWIRHRTVEVSKGYRFFINREDCHLLLSWCHIRYWIIGEELTDWNQYHRMSGMSLMEGFCDF